MAEDYVPTAIMVTGAAGFIGSHFVNYLMAQQPHYKVVVFDMMQYCASVQNLSQSRGNPRLSIVKGDVRSVDLVNHVLLHEKIDTVVHFAANTHVDNSFGNSMDFTKSNVDGTHTLLECCRAYGKIRRFIHVSTDEVYGENPPADSSAKSFSESLSTLDPTNPYAATKAAAEMICRSYIHSYKMPIIITRGNNVYGECQFPEKLVPKFALLALAGRDLCVHGDGSQRRSFLHAADVARAFYTILLKGTAGEIYNIGTEKEKTVIDVANTILKMLPDSKSKVVHVGDRLFNDQRYFIDSSKLHSLGWREEVPWESGLRRTLEWYRAAPPDYWGVGEIALAAHPVILPNSCPDSVVGASDAAKGVKRTFDAGPGEEAEERFLIFGRTGWLGGMLGEICQEKGYKYQFAQSRLEQKEAIEFELDAVKPTHVLNAAGVTGRPNVDWCEDHRAETLRTNVVGTLCLADACETRGLHMTNFATGCIFHYDAEHPMPEPGTRYTGKGFTEEDSANFFGSYYSKTKGMVEEMLKAYKNVLTLRVRMPIGDDLEFPRNFVYKISRYARVVNIPNSMTVLPELMPMAVELARRKCTGIMNFTNPGVVSHGEVLDLYREYYKKDFTYKTFTLEEQAQVIKAGRSNNELDATRLKKEFPEMLDIHASLVKYVFEPASKKRKV